VKRVELLTVAERFKVNRVGLILVPDFPLRDGWKDIKELVLVVAPDGREIEVQANFRAAHFNTRRSSTSSRYDRSWRIVISLLGVGKAEVPTGSKILTSPHVLTAVLGHAP
jgi:hypothetical protein